MRKNLAKESIVYGGITVLCVALSMAVSKFFVFIAVCFGIMFISSMGGYLFSTKKDPDEPKDKPVQSGFPFALNENDIKGQLDLLKKQHENGEIDDKSYTEKCAELESFIK